MTDNTESWTHLRTQSIARLLGGLFVAGFLVFGAGEALACSGTRLLDDDTSDEFAAADVVFTGTAIRRDEPFRLGDTISTADPITWTFAVDAIEKGFAGNRITITSPRNDASCGIPFALGHRYRVRAHASGLFGLEAIQGDADEIEALATAPPIETGGIDPSMPGALLAVVLFVALALITIRVATVRRSPSGDP